MFLDQKTWQKILNKFHLKKYNHQPATSLSDSDHFDQTSHSSTHEVRQGFVVNAETIWFANSYRRGVFVRRHRTLIATGEMETKKGITKISREDCLDSRNCLIIIKNKKI